MSGRRSSSDKDWQEVKNIVKTRDNNSCRLCKCISIVELMLLKRNAGSLIGVLDPAHIIPVSSDPSIMYKSCNIVLLNRYSHEMLDSYRDPIDGHNITKEEVNKWWVRILKKNMTQTQEFKELLGDRGIFEF